jgi:hypothetical protein
VGEAVQISSKVSSKDDFCLCFLLR